MRSFESEASEFSIKSATREQVHPDKSLPVQETLPHRPTRFTFTVLHLYFSNILHVDRFRLVGTVHE